MGSGPLDYVSASALTTLGVNGVEGHYWMTT
jgi:hypothetical protein